MRSVLISVVASMLLAPAATAGTCTVEVLADEQATWVRVCDVAADGGCGALLFEGELQPGESRTVESVGDRLVYEAIDAATGTTAPLTTAVCDGGTVEL